MTPSTTNTAARELDGWIKDGDTIPAPIIKACHDAIQREFGDSGSDGYYKRILVRVFKALRRTLTQQQGGEQEADVEQQARELLAKHLEDGGAKHDALEVRSVERQHMNGFFRISLDAITAALRTKQPAASDCDRDRDTGRRRAAVEILLATGWQWQEGKWQPAASEGGAVHIMRAAFVTADENYSGKRVAAVYADASMIGQRVHIIPAVSIDNTSKQAAGEAVELEQFRPAVVNWRNEQRGTIKILSESLSPLGAGAQKLAEGRLREAERLIAIIDAPPRHPADEALIAAYDAGFAASDEGWNAEIWPDVESRPDYYVNDRAEAIAAIQAGTP